MPGMPAYRMIRPSGKSVVSSRLPSFALDLGILNQSIYFLFRIVDEIDLFSSHFDGPRRDQSESIENEALLLFEYMI